MINSLIIIGNGFDLNCKLSSSFSDFFKTKLDEVRKSADTSLNFVCSNIWYLFFYFAFYDERYFEYEGNRIIERIYNNNPLWMDVEGLIKKLVATKRTDDAWMKVHIPSMYNDFPSLLNYLFASRNQHYIIGETNQYSAIKKYFKNKTTETKSFDIFDFLYDELLRFEQDFKTYLKNEVDTNENYKKNYEILMKRITESQKEHFSIISFNYTPFLSGQKRKSQLKTFYNIHGELKKHIIIGFDSSDISDNSFASVKLCKAWQKMNFTKDLFGLPNKDEIDEIKFYGHSLGKQDYSYFHAIFDYYDIYNSDISLVFYYTEYKDDPNENREIRNNFLKQIFSLLNDYAIKSGNEEKVKTIISKLQLENRLIITPVAKIQ